MHVFITGERGVGKTTLLRQIISHFPKEKIYGFYTRKISLEDEEGEKGAIFMFSAGASQEKCHVVARFWGSEGKKVFSQTFDTFGVTLLENIPEGSLVIMDELGFLESSSPKFQEKVLEVLDQKVMVLGVIKPNIIPFLEKVRQHPRVRMVTLLKKEQKLHCEKCKAIIKLLSNEEV